MPCGSQEEHSLMTSCWEVESLQCSLLACESCLKLRCGQNESTRALLDNRERGGVLVFCTLHTRHIDTDCSALLKTDNKSSHTHPLTLQLHITWHCVERVSKLGVPHVFSCFRVFVSFPRFPYVSLFRVFCPQTCSSSLFHNLLLSRLHRPVLLLAKSPAAIFFAQGIDLHGTVEPRRCDFSWCQRAVRTKEYHVSRFRDDMYFKAFASFSLNINILFTMSEISPICDRKVTGPSTPACETYPMKMLGSVLVLG